MSLIDYRGTAWGSPTGASPIPADVVYAVREWARNTGRIGATVVWNNLLQCPEVRLPLKDGDPRLRAYQEGRTPVNYEPVFLHRKEGKHKVAIPLESSVVTAFLEEMDAQSGRGRYANMQACVDAADEYNRNLRDSVRKAAADNSAMRTRSYKKQVMRDIDRPEPVVTVPANVGESK